MACVSMCVWQILTISESFREVGYVQFFAKVSDNPRFLTTMLAHLRWNPYLIWYEYPSEFLKLHSTEIATRIFVDQISR